MSPARVRLGFEPRSSWAAWHLAWRAFRRVIAVRLMLWRRSQSQVRAALLHSRRRERTATPILLGDRDLAREPEALAWAVRAAARRVLMASCLTQAIALESLLAEADEVGIVRFGVARKPDGAFEAHAWVEHAGRILIGDLPDLDRFAVLPEGTSPGRLETS